MTHNVHQFMVDNQWKISQVHAFITYWHIPTSKQEHYFIHCDITKQKETLGLWRVKHAHERGRGNNVRKKKTACTKPSRKKRDKVSCRTIVFKWIIGKSIGSNLLIGVHATVTSSTVYQRILLSLPLFWFQSWHQYDVLWKSK